MDLVLNWLWQGTAIALAAAALVALAKPSARVRHGVWSLALVLVVITPLIRLLRQLVFVPAVSSAAMPALASVEDSAALLQLPNQWWTSNAVMMGIWAGWAVVHAARLVSAMAALLRAKRRCQSLPRQFEPRLALWNSLRTKGRPTRLALSNGVQSAAVLGGPAPVVALSPTVVDELSIDEIDCLVAHEWAHVQRRDDVAALVQAVVRVLAGWHPAVWWLDRRISAEREHACDEAVVQLTGSAKGYAACLVKVASLSMQPVRPLPVVAMSATGLRPRVLRVLSGRAAGGSSSGRGASLLGAAALATLAVSIADVRLIEGASPATVERSAGEPDTVAPIPLSAGALLAPVREAAAPAPVPATSAATGKSRPRVPAATPMATSTAPAPALRAAEPSQARTTESTVPANGEPLQEVASRPLLPGQATMPPLREGLAASGAGVAPAPAVSPEPTPWGAAADAGVAIGRGSQKAAVATAGFFSRVGRKIASSF